MQGRIATARIWCAMWLVGCLAVSSSGCAGLAAQMLYVFSGGDRIPAEYAGLDKCKIAVVCISANSAFGPDDSTAQLARKVEELLRRHGQKIQFVSQQKVVDWIDSHDWDQIDFDEIGKGLGAEKVLAINLQSMSLHEGNTTAFFKGRAELLLTVHDIANGGGEVWRKQMPQFEYPKNGVHHSNDLNTPAFRQLFIAHIADQIARRFYSYEVQDDVARDAELLSH